MSWQKQYALDAPELITLESWLKWVCTLLETEAVYLGHGTDNYWDESLQLVLGALKLPVNSGREILPLVLSEEDKNHVFLFLQERIDKRRPLPYITNQAWFMEMPFYVDERVLIPRSPIGAWISKRFSPWVNRDSVVRIADIGTGSGCIAIGLAWAFPAATVDALDISEEALLVASRNIYDYELSSRVRVVQGDAFKALDGQYDLIVSNPPYVPAAEAAFLPHEYRHEPSQALFSGESGLDMVDEMLKNAYHYLNEGGIFVLEVGQTAINLVERYPNLAFVWLSCDEGGEGVLLLEKNELPH